MTVEKFVMGINREFKWLGAIDGEDVDYMERHKGQCPDIEGAVILTHVQMTDYGIYKGDDKITRPVDASYYRGQQECLNALLANVKKCLDDTTHTHLMWRIFPEVTYWRLDDLEDKTHGEYYEGYARVYTS